MTKYSKKSVRPTAAIICSAFGRGAFVTAARRKPLFFTHSVSRCRPTTGSRCLAAKLHDNRVHRFRIKLHDARMDSTTTTRCRMACCHEAMVIQKSSSLQKWKQKKLTFGKGLLWHLATDFVAAGPSRGRETVQYRSWTFR
jgi:hypothetical protein